VKIKDDSDPTITRRGQTLAAAGGLVGAVAASSCCILPLVLFSFGMSGAWMGNLTQLAPYQLYFIAATFGFLGYGYWRVYRSSVVECAGSQACARPLPNRLVKAGLVVATVLVVAAIAFDFVAPLFLSS